ncbi:Ankyrin-1 [Tetrabaena socialis]|uniref:Ankyrin-1 n=1 Tax=Tetrabaena socialis TaxID=47790 RepID=A0A2J7ZMY9_9CHLO|nr:Ankyrin-1 [Tetrabaena socialis]|eukprot:PNH01635.1 Ankyrin-1 [Tetrabaena socialis]
MMRASGTSTPAGAAALSSAPAQIVLSYRVPETGAVELGGNGMVLRMQERLQHAGFSVFVGEASLQGGDAWDDMIQAAVEGCSVFVALCSPTYCMWGVRLPQLAASRLLAAEGCALEGCDLPDPDDTGRPLLLFPALLLVLTGDELLLRLEADPSAPLAALYADVARAHPASSPLVYVVGLEAALARRERANKALVQPGLAGRQPCGAAPAGPYGQTAWTKRELQIADSDRKAIIPVWMEGAYPPRGVRMYLIGKQRLPQGDKPMVEVDFETAMLELVVCIQRAGCYPGMRPERPLTAGRQQLPKLPATSFRASSPAGPAALAALSPLRARALLLACKAGEVAGVELQLRSPAVNPNVQDKSGSTALQIACRAGHEQVAALLLAAGAAVDAKDKVRRRVNKGRPAIPIAPSPRRRPAVALLPCRPAAPPPSCRCPGPPPSPPSFPPCRWAALPPPRLAAAPPPCRRAVAMPARRHAAPPPRRTTSPVCLTCCPAVLWRAQDGLTPLQFAISEGHAKVAQVLLQAGAAINTRDQQSFAGCCGAVAGARAGAVSICRGHLLTDTPSSPLCCTQEGRAPLHTAVVGGHKEAVEVMINAGADVDVKDKVPWGVAGGEACEGLEACAGATPLHIASQGSSADIAEVLLRAGADADVKDKKLATPLHVASVHGRVAVAEALVRAGADVGAKDKGESSPLHVAGLHGQAEVAEALLRAGADVGAVDKNQWTPLHAASSKGHTAVVKVLMRAKANVGAKTNAMSTPLHIASLNGHAAAAETLLQAGADVGAKTKEGWTPLHIASWKGHSDVAAVLLKAGADASSEQKVGAYVPTGGMICLGRLMHPAHCAPPPPMECRPPFTGLTNAHLLAPILPPAKEGKTPMQVAMGGGHKGAVQVLLQALVPTSAEDTRAGLTPLHIASRDGRMPVVEALLFVGAEVDAKDKGGRTPLLAASQEGRTAVVAALLRAGANVRTQDQEGKTPLHAASEKGRSEAGSTAMSVAKQQGKHEVVALLQPAYSAKEAEEAARAAQAAAQAAEAARAARAAEAAKAAKAAEVARAAEEARAARAAEAARTAQAARAAGQSLLTECAKTDPTGVCKAVRLLMAVRGIDLDVQGQQRAEHLGVQHGVAVRRLLRIGLVHQKKQPVMSAVSATTRISSARKLLASTNTMMMTSTAVMSTPAHSGMPKSRLKAMAQPTTSARSRSEATPSLSDSDCRNMAKIDDSSTTNSSV